ncbi:hypothetical protein CN234_16915 [Sinorhizobium meliloti]|uniref:hypothetical protein n=1 Tax=Rhizobium meliloti TaxID=382 RepID=UPI000FD903D5|nr:hypothetical protein [Sinorhizobium meliloti]RVG08833.1 hypothetical protein CN234_16915 [Sinorhizobium meliloti]
MMETLLSDHLKATRDSLKVRGMFGLFLRPSAVRSFVKRFNTFIALAEELEDDLHLARLKAGAESYPSSATIMRFPTRIVLVPRADERGELA